MMEDWEREARAVEAVMNSVDACGMSEKEIIMRAQAEYDESSNKEYKEAWWAEVEKQREAIEEMERKIEAENDQTDKDWIDVGIREKEAVGKVLDGRERMEAWDREVGRREGGTVRVNEDRGGMRERVPDQGGMRRLNENQGGMRPDRSDLTLVPNHTHNG
jgi:hypothetical protein